MPIWASLGALMLAAAGFLRVASAGEIGVVAEAVAPAETPVIDGRADNVWTRVRAARFTLSEGSQGDVEVTVRAIHTKTHLYLLVEWADETKSHNRFYRFTGKRWRPTRGREDRLNIAWNIDNSVKDFPAKGCSALCHKIDGVMRTNAPGEKVDLWYWMAQRTNPVGYGDDWVMGHKLSRLDNRETGRRPDAPSGGPFAPNWSEASKRPRFTFKPGAEQGPVLLKNDAVKLTEATEVKRGYRVPREVLMRPRGPRAGIEARGVWEEGRWTVELKRALVTGDADDMQFRDPGPFYFGVSIHDDAEKDEHAQMGRNVLRLRLR